MPLRPTPGVPHPPGLSDPTTAADGASGRGAGPLPSAVFWDMDGTLVDTEPLWNASQRALVEQDGGRWTTELAHSLVGQALDHGARLLQDAGVTLGVGEIIEHTMTDVVRAVRRTVPWRPGAREMLAALRHAEVPCALVTMSHAPLAAVFAESLPAGTLEFLVTGDMVLRGKPDPEPYTTALGVMARRHAGLDPSACVAVEDSLPGLRSAAGAGLATVAVPHVMAVPDDPRWEQWTTLAGRTPGQLAQVAARRSAAS
ncbi:HAD family hydrolase [Citricoccus sp. I39-566]|uniref:HAD family hydrolase n=1 Tax=Citricoccus sp. I39-566 TaxID=3073268 RepID=UPI00286CED2E|nr:HAD family hydrolase [Citricoccus sp. I39-566]WMY77365.1 HAD family hydrolase [Citricoccus sp. I39-566]